MVTNGAGPDRLGIFVGGFRWSGSGAVADWLLGHGGIAAPRSTEKAFGEIRAVNYGMRFCLKALCGRGIGARLGRYALYPDGALSRRLFPRLPIRGGFASRLAASAADALFFAAASLRVIPKYPYYAEMLSGQLGRDFRDDGQYLDAVRGFYDACLERTSRAGKLSVEDLAADDAFREAASKIVALFYDRLGEEGRVPLFENAFSGLTPRFADFPTERDFPRLAFILVYRDPRDQFLDLLANSGSTFPWSYPSFCKSYEATLRGAADYVSGIAPDDPHRFCRLVRFEDFVHDVDGVRTGLRDDLNRFWAGHAAMGKPWTMGKFDPAASGRNIGMWRAHRGRKDIRYIEARLGEYLFRGADL